MTLGCRGVTITNGILIVVSSETSYCLNHGNCTDVFQFFLTQIIWYLLFWKVILKVELCVNTFEIPSVTSVRTNFKLSWSSDPKVVFSQLLVPKKCARLTTVKTCSAGPWLSMCTVMLPGFHRILLGTTWRKDAPGNMKHRIRKEQGKEVLKDKRKKLVLVRASYQCALPQLKSTQAFREYHLGHLGERIQETRSIIGKKKDTCWLIWSMCTRQKTPPGFHKILLSTYNF